MELFITNDLEKQIEQAKAIVQERKKYYSDEVLESIKNTVREKTNYTSEDSINSEMYKTIYFYWAYGCPVSEYYFLDFANKSHDEIKEFVTMREKVVYRNRLNKFEDAHLLNNKWDTYNLFKDFYGRDVIKIEKDEDFSVFCDFISNHPEFVVKPTDMGGGSGVHKVTTNLNISYEEKYYLFKKLLSEIEKNKALYQRGSENSLIIEELIDQAPELSVMHPDSVNGIRVTTVKVGNKINIVHPWFKIGRGGQFLTSAVYGTLDACIDSDSGKVITPGYTENNESFENHPDTGIQILGFQIPYWDQLLTVVKELASRLDTINYVGWDMVLTKNGWALMEGNFSGDFMWQMCLKRGTKREFEDMIGWKLTKDFWWQE
ncbi:MAG: hypothetical protein IKE94_04240 [Aeriscardovia sp.]|nr:hypothetical protein [Aeriscardovia sp.]